MQLIVHVFILGAAVVASPDRVERQLCGDACRGYCGGQDDCAQNTCSYLGQKMLRGCNTCECILNGGLLEWICGKDRCAVDFEVINAINNDPECTWTATNYGAFEDKTLDEVIKYKLGTWLSTTHELKFIRFNKHIAYPTSYDARQCWPQLISDVSDQGWCATDWATTTANVVNDRYAIHSGGGVLAGLSPHTVLPCGDPNYSQTGNDSDIKTTNACEGPRTTLGKIWNCVVHKKMLKGTPLRLIGEQDIMYDIMTNGPVQAVMIVYRDLFLYRGGVYRKTRYASDRDYGQHSVRVIGWGEENYQKYWIVANTWGSDWGENGTFRIARGVSECFIESYVVTVLYDSNILDC